MESSLKKVPPSPFPTDTLPESFSHQSDLTEISGVEASILQLVEALETQGVAIQQHPDIMNLLLRLNISETIPQEVDILISEILDWLTELKTQIPLCISRDE
jgi:type III secretion system FlhB-like substrate exporter